MTNPTPDLDRATREAVEARWLPIESAPKDGTLVIVGNEYGTWLAKYEEQYLSGYRPSNPWSTMLLNMKHMRNPQNYIPTHWMPLPAPPAAIRKDQP